MKYIYILFYFIFSPIYLLGMLTLLSFVYTTWTQRIWPEIRVPEADPGPEPEWTPVSPDVLSAPELVRLWEDFHSKLCQFFSWLKNLRCERKHIFRIHINFTEKI